nr:putative RNA-dependent RNA polymerase [Rhizoctonia solani mitovirus 116]
MKRFNRLSAYMLNTKSANAMISVKGGVALIKALLSVMHAIGLPVTSARVRALVSLLRKLNKLVLSQGIKGTTLYLKSCAVMLQQALGGFKVNDLGKLGPRVSRTNSGYPRLINRVHRTSIRQGDSLTIRLYLSVFNIYRVLTFEGKVDTSSITAPLSVAQTGFWSTVKELKEFVPIFWDMLKSNFGIDALQVREKVMRGHLALQPFPLLKSSPNTGKFASEQEFISSPPSNVDQGPKPLNIHPETGEWMVGISTHPFAIYQGIYSLFNDKTLADVANYFLGLTHPSHPLRAVVPAILKIPRLTGPKGLFAIWTTNLGKLSIKEEAAGKMRIFAMVDAFTQWNCRPLHDGIFEGILRRIPQDGTFNQMSPINRLVQVKPGYLASFDLKSATDRIPLEPQTNLIAGVMGREYALNWGNLLTARTYWLKQPMVQSQPLTYSVGQPMGALSSWPSLALIHHFIVQFCAYKVYGTLKWFTMYAVLGDDIVIGDRLVAEEYKAIMARLGVVIGLPKSIISSSGTTLEFAKRTIHNGVDVSPVPLKELQATFRSPSALVTFSRKYNLGFTGVAKLLGFGYRVLGGLNRPFNSLNGKLKMVIFAINTPTNAEEAKSFFQLGAPKTMKGFKELKDVINALVSQELPLMKRKLNALRLNGYTLEIVEALARDLSAVICAQANVAVVKHNRKGVGDELPSIRIQQVLPVVRWMIFAVQIESKCNLHAQLSKISSDLVTLMLEFRDLDFFDLYMKFIELQKEMAKLPLSNLGFERLLEDNQSGLSDTMHIRMWRRLAKYLFAQVPVKVKDLGIGMPHKPCEDTKPQGSLYYESLKRDFIRDTPPHMDPLDKDS